MHTTLCIHTLCIVVCIYVCHCVALSEFPSHPSFNPTLWLECIQLSVHVCMSSCLTTFAPSPFYRCVQLSLFWSQTLIRKCTCISKCMNIHLTPHICSTPLHSCVQTRVPLCGPMGIFQSPPSWSNTLIRMCTCISICMHATLLPISVPLLLHSCMQRCMHCVAQRVFQSILLSIAK